MEGSDLGGKYCCMDHKELLRGLWLYLSMMKAQKDALGLMKQQKDSSDAVTYSDRIGSLPAV